MVNSFAGQLRVFVRRTAMTPDDRHVRIGYPTLFDKPGRYESIHVSVTFTWDIVEAERLKRAWEPFGKVLVGGPAFNEPEGEFVPGLYLKKGVVITSRGCPNKCWFCEVWKRHPSTLELHVHPGNVIQDDNLLACSDAHIKKVFKMLRNQRAVEFRGIDAARLKPWHVEEMAWLSITQIFCSYDRPEELEPLQAAGEMFKRAGFTGRKLRCYVLIGYRGDTLENAEKRLRAVDQAGFLPFAMLYEDGRCEQSMVWRRFQRPWARPAATKAKLKAVATSAIR